MRNLIDYEPPFIAEYTEIQKICESEQPEINGMWTSINSAFLNMFVSALDEYGCSRWEKILKLTPLSADTLEDRRFAISTIIRSELPYTYTSVKKMLIDLCGGEENFTMELDNDNYTLIIRMSLGIKRQYDIASEKIKNIVPANLIVDFSLQYNPHLTFLAMSHYALKQYTHRYLREDVFEFPPLFIGRILGKTEQVQYSGKNLVKVSSDNVINYSSIYANYIINYDSTISITGSSLFGFGVNVKPNTTYTFSIGNNESQTVRIREYKTNDGTWGTASDGNYISQTVNQKTRSVTFTTTSDTEFVRCVFYFDVSLQFPQELHAIQFEEGSTKTSYEPYVGGIPSPNPQYPQTIDSVERIDIRTVQNIHEGLPVEYGYVADNGMVQSSSVSKITDYIELSSFAVVNLSLTTQYISNHIKQLVFYDDNKNHISNVNQTVVGKQVFEMSAEVPTNAKYVRAVVRLDDTDIRLFTNEQTLSVTPPRPLNRIGDYVDVMDVDNGVWEYATNGKKFSECAYTYQVNHFVLTNGTNDKRIVTSNSGNPPSLLYSDIYTAETVKASNVYPNNYGIAEYALTGGSTRLFITDNRATTKEQLVSLIGDHYIYYVLETPTTEPIDADTLVRLRAILQSKPDVTLTVTDQLGRNLLLT